MSLHHQFEHKIEIPYSVYKANRVEIWIWIASRYGRIHFALNPNGIWSAGFMESQADESEVYQFTFKDPNHAMLFKLTWL